MFYFHKLMGAFSAILLSLLVNISTSSADSQTNDDPMYFALSGGLSIADVSKTANTNGQALANALGQTVLVEYDRASWAGRLTGGYEISDSVNLEVGYFMSGDIDITYSIPGVSASESYSASGFDFAVKYDFEDSGLFAKVGLHNSDLDARVSVSLSGSTVASAAASSSGTGTMIGAGFERKDANGDVTFFGYDLYMDIGDVAGADFGYLYYGWRF